MSLFQRSFINNDQSSFPPIIRLLNEFDRYSNSNTGSIMSHSKSFTPKFDIKEHDSGYELHGELPGIDQKDVSVEFTNPSTLTIKGRVEHSYSNKSGGASEEKENKDGSNDRKEVSGSERKEKFWVQERSVGEFSRSFGFPDRVDQDNVKASMKNGVLSILVPKLKRNESKRITIE